AHCAPVGAVALSTAAIAATAVRMSVVSRYACEAAGCAHRFQDRVHWTGCDIAGRNVPNTLTAQRFRSRARTAGGAVVVVQPLSSGCRASSSSPVLPICPLSGCDPVGGGHVGIRVPLTEDRLSYADGWQDHRGRLVTRKG